MSVPSSYLMYRHFVNAFLKYRKHPRTITQAADALAPFIGASTGLFLLDAGPLWASCVIVSGCYYFSTVLLLRFDLRRIGTGAPALIAGGSAVHYALVRRICCRQSEATWPNWVNVENLNILVLSLSTLFQKGKRGGISRPFFPFFFSKCFQATLPWKFRRNNASPYAIAKKSIPDYLSFINCNTP